MEEMKWFANSADEHTAYLIMKVGIIIAERNKTADFEDIFEMAKKIYLDWKNRVDIQSAEEEGYVQKYAERIVSKLFMKVKPKRTLHNWFGEVLFKEGRKYDAVVKDGYYHIKNENDVETLIRENRIDEEFIIC